MEQYIWLIVFDILIFATAGVYLTYFRKRNVRPMIVWGFSWLIYGLGILCFILYSVNGIEEFLIIRKVMDMMNIVLMLMGAYTFLHIETPQYWYRFSFYLMILAAIDLVYEMHLLSFYLPVSTYQLVVSVAICRLVIKNWNVSAFSKSIGVGAFFCWGAGKALFSIFEVFSENLAFFVVIEIIMFISVNFCIIIIYMEKTRGNAQMEDNLYKKVVENSSDAIFYFRIKPYQAYEYMSPAIEDLLGYAPNDFYSNPDILKEIAEQEYLDEMAYLLEGEGEPTRVISVELFRKDGKKLWVEISCTAILNREGEVEAMQGSIRDVTDVKTAEVELINMTRSRNTLFSYISHELRTPVTSILGYMTAINDGVFSTEEEKAEAMDVIFTKVGTLKKLVDDIDQLSKLETHQFSFDFQTFNTSELTEMLIAANMGDMLGKGFDVEVKADLRELEHYWIIADNERINQVFMNLLSNAMKYSDEKKKIVVSFSIDEAMANYVVSVKDSGIGIKAEDIPFVFDRFYRAEYNKGREGRGLGLTLCREIIGRHQGNIYVDSVFGEGSTFTFIIPLHKES